MNDHDPHNDFTDDARRLLRRSETDIDELTLARLRAARHRAVAAQAEHHRWPPGDIITLEWLRDHRVLAAAIGVMAIAVIWTMLHRPQTQPQLVPMFEDLELLGSGDDFELYRDLDFYLWMDDEQIRG